MDCDVCLDKSDTLIKCICNTKVCINCIIKYKKINCLNCDNIYSDKDIKPFIQNKEFYNIYKYIYVKNKISSYDINKFTLYDLIKTNKQLLRFGITIKNVKKITHIDINSFLCYCPTKDCKGIISKNNTICMYCNKTICLQCHDVVLDNHECDINTINTLTELNKTSKPCPTCLFYITKTEGCNDMFCTNCGTRFCWRTGEIHETNTNNHYSVNKKLLYRYINNNTQYNIQVYKFLNYVIKYLNNFNYKTLELEYNYYKGCKNIINKAYMLYKKFDFFKYIYDNKNNCKELKNLSNILKVYYNNTIVPNNCIYYINNKNCIILNQIKKSKEICISNECDNNYDKGIELLDIMQMEHALNIKNKLLLYKRAYDMSIPGSGKSYVALYVAKQLNIKNVFIITPPCVLNKWNEIIKKYNKYNGFNYIVVSTNNLCIKKFRENNSLLNKYINSNNKVSYEATNTLINFLSHKSILILDESHTIRNVNSSTLKAIYKIVNTCNGYILNISATPIEKRSQLRHVVKKIGITSSLDETKLLKDFIEYVLSICTVDELKKVYNKRHLYTIIEKKPPLFYKIRGIFTLDKLLMENIYNDYKRKIYSNLIKLLFSKISYTSPVYDEINPYIAVYKLNSTQESMIDLAFTHIDVVNRTNTLEFNNRIIKGLIQIETAMLNSIINIASIVLDNTNNTKVIISLNYTSSIEDIYDELRNKYNNTLVINGKTKNKTSLINKFQEPNNEYRLLIVNPLCINNGLDLDDKYGNFRRFVIYNPNLISINMYQFIYRFLRKDSKSKPIIHILDTHRNVLNKLKNRIHMQHDIFHNIRIMEEYDVWEETDESIINLINELENIH